MSIFEGMKKGDIFTMAGQFKRRTFWQWLTNAERELQQFTIVSDTTATYVAYKPLDNSQKDSVE